MGFFGKLKNQFNSSELKSKKSHVRNMYAIALCDGELDNNEFDFIMHISTNKLYLDGKTVQEIINNSDEISFHIPDNEREKLSHLEDYVKLSMIDGEINQKEVAVCKRIAASYGYRPVVIDKLFKIVLESMADGVARDIALKKALNELS